ncbi:hypothetical protein D3C78_1577710 [compost metagenome]
MNVEMERGPRLHRAAQGLPPKHFARLKQRGRTLAVLSGDTEKEAYERALRLAETLFTDQGGWAVEPA